MKKFLSIFLAIVMLFSVLTLVGCENDNDDTKDPAGDETKGETVEELKLGLGIVPAYGKSTSAEGETNGKTEIVATVAAVLLNKDGKIVQCKIDAAQNNAEYTADGKAVSVAESKTKGELGADYGMSAYGTDLNGDGVVKEWNEQVAVFVDSVKGKTIAEVKTLVVDGYASSDIQTAGCTMGVSEFVTALEKAVANATESKATANDKLQLGVVTSQTVADATAEKDGTNEFNTTFTAAVIDKDSKIVAAATDALQATVKFDIAGVCKTDTTVAMSTKKALGENYGMATYGSDLNGDGTIKEWHEQAAAFDAALIGKTASEITGLEKDGYGIDSLQTAGCTIGISDLVKAAVKAATVA